MQHTLERAGVFDPGVVSHLTGHADDAAMGFVFASRFRELLPHRLRRISQALEASDVDEALDAVLSLKVSAATLGAREMSGLAAEVERCVRAGAAVDAQVASGELVAAADRLDSALAGFLEL